MVRTKSWSNGGAAQAGAVIWGNGSGGTVGEVSAANALTGTQSGDSVGNAGITALPNGNYIVHSSAWNNDQTVDAGAVTYGAGSGGLVGTITAENSVRGAAPGGGGALSYAFDPMHETLVVGRPADNLVSIFKPTYTSIADGAWSAGATWNYGAFAQPHDVYIPDGRTISLDGVKTVGSLRIGCTGALSGANSAAYVIGHIRKDFCSAGAFQYPSGTANGFSPVDANVTALGVSPSSLTVGATGTAHPSLSAGHSLKRFWTLTESGDLTADLIFNYLDADVSGAEQTYKLYRLTGGSPSPVMPFVLDAGANTIGANGIDEFSEWSAGNAEPIVLNVGGRIAAADGAGIGNAKVVLTDAEGASRVVFTGPFGLYNFDNVEPGATYTVSVSARRHSFAQPAQTVTVNDNLHNVNFVAQ